MLLLLGSALIGSLSLLLQLILLHVVLLGHLLLVVGSILLA